VKELEGGIRVENVDSDSRVEIKALVEQPVGRRKL